MAFAIKKIKNTPINLLASALGSAILNSRFTAELEWDSKSISFHNIRLKQSKHYCGNHPFSCPVRPGGNAPHKRTTFLEGADWVEWNDMLNNVLDDFGASASVASSHCVIRKGTLRRMDYDGHLLGNDIDAEWNRDSEKFEDWTNKNHPRATYPVGTPGLYTL